MTPVVDQKTGFNSQGISLMGEMVPVASSSGDLQSSAN